MSVLREHARAIWQAAVEAVLPDRLMSDVLGDPASQLRAELERAPRIVVVGAGKAGAAMSAAVEHALPHCLDRMTGLVNVPAGTVRILQAIKLHAARPDASNQPTAEGVEGTRRVLELVRAAGPEDVVLCLLSGGGSALLPAPVEGVTLEHKQHVTRLLHECGATINEMNAVRKHLSAVKGGRLAQERGDGPLYSLIISDVVGDPLDVIASGPTAADPTTFADALDVLRRYRLAGRVPAVVAHLERGSSGSGPDTPKKLPAGVRNLVIGNNARALAAAQGRAEGLGYRVLNLGSWIQGETAAVAVALAGVARSVQRDVIPLAPPVCLLSGGETTVTMPPDHGLGGRNQEFVLAAALALGNEGMRDAVVLSGGTDGEDGPTDAAGAFADLDTLERAARLGLSAADFLARHDAYHFFRQTGDLLLTGLTGTNVMDVRVLLVGTAVAHEL